MLPAAPAAADVSTERNPSVTFSTPGVKQVTLEVCNNAGCRSVTREVVVLDPMPQIVSLGAVPSLLGTGQAVTLSAQTKGRPPLSHRWVIAGGLSDIVLTGNPVVWNTATPGTGSFQVRLEVWNSDGTLASAPIPVTVKRVTFADVPVDHWAWGYIESLYSQGITTGCAAAPLRFCPGTMVSRAEMAVFLIRGTHGASFIPLAPFGLFADATISFWASPYIEQLYVDGITTGCAANPLRFCPSDLLTRSQMAVFLLRAKHGGAYVPPPATGTLFADVPANHWAAAWIERLYAEGITTGCMNSPLRFCPEDTVTREQMAAFLARTFSLPLP